MKSVIDLFRELREDHDYSQSDVAAVLGISQQHYSKYETGEYELPLRHFITLAEYYGVSADYLIAPMGIKSHWRCFMLLAIVLVKSWCRTFFLCMNVGGNLLWNM